MNLSGLDPAMYRSRADPGDLYGFLERNHGSRRSAFRTARPRQSPGPPDDQSLVGFNGQFGSDSSLHIALAILRSGSGSVQSSSFSLLFSSRSRQSKLKLEL